MLTVIRGENAILRWNLLKPDEVTPLLLTDIVALSVVLTDANDKVIMPAVHYPSSLLRAGETVSQIELEVRVHVIKQAVDGIVKARFELQTVDSEYELDSGQVNILTSDALTVAAA